MIIDFYKGNGGGGSGSQGPIGPQGPQGIEGAQGYQGPVGQDGIDQNPTVLKSVAELPESAETGDLVSLSVEEQGLPNGILFEERNDLGENQDKTGGRFQFEIGAFDGIAESDALYVGKVITPNDSEISLYVFENEWKTGGAVLSDSNGNLYISMGVDSDSAGESNIEGAIFNYQYTSSEDEYMVVDIYPETTGSVSFDLDITEGQLGVYQYDGTDWNKLGEGGQGGDSNTLQAVSEFNPDAQFGDVQAKIITDEAITDGVWQYSPVSGAIAEWSNLPARSEDNVRSFALSFDYIPDGTELFRVRYFSVGYYTKLVYSGNALYTFTEQDGYTNGTYFCSMNDSGATLGLNTNINLKISKHNITFYQLQSSGFGLFFWEGFWDCMATGAHWFRIDRPAPKLYLGDGTHTGLLTANDAGLIIGWPSDQPIRRINKINNTYVNFYAGSNVPNIWAPTDGGTAGQMLISNGTGAPVWSDWIKGVKITSDEYEALATKNPNTLYLIVNDE